MTPEDRLRALNSSDRWTVNALAPRDNPFGSAAPARRRQSWKLIFAEIAVVAAVGAIIFGAITLQNRPTDNTSDDPVPIVPTSTPTPEITLPPVPSNTPEPPPTHAPAAPKVARIVVSSVGVELQSKDGDVVDEFIYLDEDAEKIIETMTDLLAVDPVVTRQDAVTHFLAFDHYEWGGFIVEDLEGGAAKPFVPDFRVKAWASEVNGITIVTASGVGIGTPESRIRTISQDLGLGAEYGDNDGYWVVETADVPDYELDGDGGKPAVYNTMVAVEGDATVVTRILAPGRNFGD